MGVIFSCHRQTLVNDQNLQILAKDLPRTMKYYHKKPQTQASEGNSTSEVDMSEAPPTARECPSWERIRIVAIAEDDSYVYTDDSSEDSESDSDCKRMKQTDHLELEAPYEEIDQEGNESSDSTVDDTPDSLEMLLEDSDADEEGFDSTHPMLRGVVSLEWTVEVSNIDQWDLLRRCRREIKDGKAVKRGEAPLVIRKWESPPSPLRKWLTAIYFEE